MKTHIMDIKIQFPANPGVSKRNFAARLLVNVWFILAVVLGAIVVLTESFYRTRLGSEGKSLIIGGVFTLITIIAISVWLIHEWQRWVKYHELVRDSLDYIHICESYVEVSSNPVWLQRFNFSALTSVSETAHFFTLEFGLAELDIPKKYLRSDEQTAVRTLLADHVRKNVQK